MKTKKIKILIKKPTFAHSTIIIDSDIKTIENLIEGEIKEIPFNEKIIMLVNKNAILENKKKNFYFEPIDYFICGNCLFVRKEDNEYKGLFPLDFPKVYEAIYLERTAIKVFNTFGPKGYQDIFGFYINKVAKGKINANNEDFITDKFKWWLYKHTNIKRDLERDDKIILSNSDETIYLVLID